MSRTDARKTPDATTIAHPSGDPIAQAPGEDNTSVPDNILIEGTIIRDMYPRRPLTPARVGQTRDGGRYSYSDPSMYLG